MKWTHDNPGHTESPTPPGSQATAVQRWWRHKVMRVPLSDSAAGRGAGSLNRLGAGPLVIAPMMALVAIVASIGVFGILERQAGWREIFVENFDVPVALGDFPGSDYGTRWMSYDGLGDTSGIGLYKPSDVLSVHDGSLDMYLHTKAGRPLGAAPIPLINGEWGGHIYGRYTIRFKTDALPGFGAGWLLWPDSNDWSEGEIDFPEGALDGTIQANQHCIGNPEEKCMAVDTGAEFSSGWHTTTIEWTPSGVVYYLDGVVVGKSPESPSTPMHLVLQTATNGVKPAASVVGHVLIDSVTIDAWG